MYRVEKLDGKVIVRDAEGHAVYSAPEDSYLVHRESTGVKVSRVKDLPDAQLLLALVNLVKIEA